MSIPGGDKKQSATLLLLFDSMTSFFGLFESVVFKQAWAHLSSNPGPYIYQLDDLEQIT